MSFPYGNVGFWPARQAELAPNRVALEIDGTRYTYLELEERAGRCTGALSASGVGPGDRVGVLLSNAIEYVDVFLACARMGAIIVPLSPRLAPPELEFMANDAGVRTLVYDGELSETVKAFRPATGIQNALAVGQADDPSFEAAVQAASSRHGVEDVDEDSVLAIFYTSGTTGRPKGAMLTHRNFFWTNLNIALAFDVRRDERSLVVLPMFHLGGWNVNTLSVWWKGGTVVVEPSFDPERTLRLIEGGLTSIMAVPTIYQLLADHPGFDPADLSSLRWCACGGAPLPVSLIRRYQERGVVFVQGYGLTEAAPNCLVLPPEDAERKAGAAGRPYFFADVRVFDGEDREVEPGGTGEIVVRGPSVMKGYWRRPEETAEALRGGWLRTGDVGRVDEGYITIVDRVKDMFISGGENVYPAEVENVLAAHPAVAEAAVIGVPHERWGEVGRAILVLRPGSETTEEEIVAFCRERLATFKVPASVRFADALPRNPTGKLVKSELRSGFGSNP